MEALKKEYFDFVYGPYLEYNKHAVSSGYTWEQVNAINTFKSFFERGLKANMIIQGNTVFEIFIDSVLKGARYAIDDGGNEVKTIVNLMLTNNGKPLKNIENIIIKPFLEVDQDVDFMDDYTCENGLWVRGVLLLSLGTDINRFYEGWDELEEDDDGPVNKKGCFQMLKFIMNRK
jgi:hypothetical protein